MKVILVGAQDMNFKAEDGNKIDGVKLHYTAPDYDGLVKGQKALQKFVARDVFNSLGFTFNELCELFGTQINVEFTEKGKLCSMAV